MQDFCVISVYSILLFILLFIFNKHKNIYLNLTLKEFHEYYHKLYFQKNKKFILFKNNNVFLINAHQFPIYY